MPTTNPEIPRRNAALVADGFKFLEGPRWRDGRLYFSDIFDHKVYALEAGGARSVIVEVPGEPSGLGWSREGDLMIASMLDRRLSRLRNGELELVADLSGHFAHEVNDIHVDASGRAWVGSFGFHLGPGATARPTDLLRVDPDGTVTVAAGGLLFPNGVASTPHGTLLVAETFGYRITEFDIAADGSLSNRRPWAIFRDQPATEHDLWLRDDCIHPDEAGRRGRRAGRGRRCSHRLLGRTGRARWQDPLSRRRAADRRRRPAAGVDGSGLADPRRARRGGLTQRAR
jgi:hypothetical protein